MQYHPIRQFLAVTYRMSAEEHLEVALLEMEELKKDLKEEKEKVTRKNNIIRKKEKEIKRLQGLNKTLREKAAPTVEDKVEEGWDLKKKLKELEEWKKEQEEEVRKRRRQEDEEMEYVRRLEMEDRVKRKYRHGEYSSSSRHYY